MYYPTLFASRHRHRRHPARPVARCHRPHYRMRQVYFECNLYDPGRPPGLWPVRRHPGTGNYRNRPRRICLFPPRLTTSYLLDRCMAANTCISSSKIREKFNLTLKEGISMATTADARVTVSISKNDVVAFLNLAATDDAFRKRLQANPTAVLAEH